MPQVLVPGGLTASEGIGDALRREREHADDAKAVGCTDRTQELLGCQAIHPCPILGIRPGREVVLSSCGYLPLTMLHHDHLRMHGREAVQA